MIVYGRVPKRHLKAIDFFSRKLFSPQMTKQLHIEISYKKNMQLFGLTTIEDYNKSGKPRYFILDIKRDITEKEKLITLAHEFIHVKQYVYDELNEKMDTWRGVIIEASDYEYHNQPWELEAEELGIKIVEEFIEQEQIIL